MPMLHGKKGAWYTMINVKTLIQEGESNIRQIENSMKF
jgi:hypothetical protein